MQTIIKKLDDDLYSGKKYCVKYKSNGFYKIEALQDAFSFRYTAFEEEKEFELSDEILAGWAAGARMIFLETQTCNENAISFYKKEGFSVIGFDQYAYANEADETHEMLVWMGKKL